MDSADTAQFTAGGKRRLIVALLEVLALFVVLELMGMSGVYRTLNRWFHHWNYAGKILWLVLPLLLILVRRRSFLVYGLALAAGWKHVRLTLGMAAVFGLPMLVGGLFGTVRLEFDIEELWLNTLIFEVLNSFSEEVLWRGYCQSRINEVTRHRWHLCGIRFGPGLFYVAVLFGLVHAFNPFNPFRGIFTVDWTWGLVAGQTGLLLGFVRARTGSIYPAVFLHLWTNILGKFTDCGSVGNQWLLLSISFTLMWTMFFVVSAIEHGSQMSKTER